METKKKVEWLKKFLDDLVKLEEEKGADINISFNLIKTGIEPKPFFHDASWREFVDLGGFACTIHIDSGNYITMEDALKGK